MFKSAALIELQKKYESGERTFSKIQLRRADLRGLNLSHADLSGADLSYANLREVDFRGANLSESCLNEADLTGANLQNANLQGAYLIKAYLIKTNLKESNLTKAYLTGAYLIKSDCSSANLSGAYLNNSKITGTILTGTYYDHTTRFDITFNPIKNELLKITPQINSDRNTTIVDLIKTFNYLSQLSINYLGYTMTTRYWEIARPKHEWLTQFQFNRFSQITFSGQKQDIEPAKIQDVQEWTNCFIQSCSKIIQDFPQMIDPKQIAFPIAIVEISSEKNLINKY